MDLPKASVDPLVVGLFQCPYRSERTVAHDTFRGIVAVIILESRTFVENEVSHFFLCHI
jgi:hypothetical protein